ncbi:carboxypeptidase-like regulatory domain-containing protein [Tunturiibacter empetritectus]|uniref:carboxypeptidase-like regulatory domain-containing protein n=1 Tax=Tunturiibacter empetritectus TaxID=3069691 RepID=UPI003D9B706E
MNKVLLRICLMCLLGVSGASAQIANNTALVGTVVDASGSSVVGAQVTATEEATQVKYTATTNSQGYYSITFIKSGVYDLSVEKGDSRRSRRWVFPYRWTLPCVRTLT